jgi:hypothetical protein
MIFDQHSDAADFIKLLPDILRELNLSDRFDAVGAPRKIVEKQQRGRHTRNLYYYAACIRDKRPHEELPEITPADIATAWENAKRKADLPRLAKATTPKEPEWTEDAIPAFGRVQDIKTWARALHTYPAVIRRYIEECGEPEAALTKIALKKSA